MSDRAERMLELEEATEEKRQARLFQRLIRDAETLEIDQASKEAVQAMLRTWLPDAPSVPVMMGERRAESSPMRDEPPIMRGEKDDPPGELTPPLLPQPRFQVRKNKGRPQLAGLVPLGALEAIARAAEVGLVKYARDSYREEGGYSVLTCLDSAARHIYALTGGEKHDPDASAIMGKPVAHLDMAIWNLSAACESMRLYGAINDDTWKGPKK